MYDVIGNHNVAFMTKYKEDFYMELDFFFFFFTKGEAMMRKKWGLE